ELLAVGRHATDQVRRVGVGREHLGGQDLVHGQPLDAGLVEQVDRPLAGLVAPARDRPDRGRTVVRRVVPGARVGPGTGAGHAREMNSPERVSTLTRSPGLMKSGTWRTCPVSRVAGFLAPETRSPC